MIPSPALGCVAASPEDRVTVDFRAKFAMVFAFLFNRLPEVSKPSIVLSESGVLPFLSPAAWA